VFTDTLFSIVGIDKVNIPSNHIQIFPNPCNDYTSITITFPEPIDFRYKIVDLNTSTTIRSGLIKATQSSSSLNLNTSGFKSGLYFFILDYFEKETGMQQEVRKIVVSKK
nr:T9SS type A sorting domain-containing protein [Bacteroidota bacterium]